MGTEIPGLLDEKVLRPELLLHNSENALNTTELTHT